MDREDDEDWEAKAGRKNKKLSYVSIVNSFRATCWTGGESHHRRSPPRSSPYK